MKLKSRFLVPSLAAALLLMQAAASHAAVIFDSELNGTSTSDIGNTNGKAIGFALGAPAALGVAAAGGYSLDSITVRLSSPGTNASTYTFSLWSDTGGDSVSGTQRLSMQLATFTSQAVPSGAASNYTLPISAPFTLQPSTIYWIASSSTAGSSLSWLFTAGGETTAAGISVTNPAGKFGGGSPSTYSSNSSNINDLQINATAIPEPSSAMLLIAAGISLTALRRRTSR